MNDKELYVAWLKDAYSTEKTLVQALQAHATDAEGKFPEMKDRLVQHREQTIHHADLIEGCLKRLGETPSSVKTGLGAITGTVKNMMNATTADELVKNTIDDYEAENLEIASYTSLIAAAQAANDPETERVCREILAQEEAMAAFVKEQLPKVTVFAMRDKAAAK